MWGERGEGRVGGSCRLSGAPELIAVASGMLSSSALPLWLFLYHVHIGHEKASQCAAYGSDRVLTEVRGRGSGYCWNSQTVSICCLNCAICWNAPLGSFGQRRLLLLPLPLPPCNSVLFAFRADSTLPAYLRITTISHCLTLPDNFSLRVWTCITLTPISTET